MSDHKDDQNQLKIRLKNIFELVSNFLWCINPRDLERMGWVQFFDLHLLACAATKGSSTNSWATLFSSRFLSCSLVCTLTYLPPSSCIVFLCLCASLRAETLGCGQEKNNFLPRIKNNWTTIFSVDTLFLHCRIAACFFVFFFFIKEQVLFANAAMKGGEGKEMTHCGASFSVCSRQTLSLKVGVFRLNSWSRKPLKQQLQQWLFILLIRRWLQ